jgi:hypothetical protein
LPRKNTKKPAKKIAFPLSDENNNVSLRRKQEGPSLETTVRFPRKMCCWSPFFSPRQEPQIPASEIVPTILHAQFPPRIAFSLSCVGRKADADSTARESFSKNQIGGYTHLALCGKMSGIYSLCVFWIS